MSVLRASPAQAYSLPVWDSDCPDPFGWASARWQPHAGYPPLGTTLPGANCTNYVAFVFIARGAFTGSTFPGLGEASSWAARASAKGFTVNHTPAVGCVAQFVSGDHVTYVEAVRGDGTLEVSESNWTIGGAKRWIDRRVISASSVDNYIHLSDGASAVAPSKNGNADMLMLMIPGTTYQFALFGPNFWYEWTASSGGDPVANAFMSQITGGTTYAATTVTSTQWASIKAATGH